MKIIDKSSTTANFPENFRRTHSLNSYPQLLSTENFSAIPVPITRYDEEFGITSYPEDNDFPLYSSTFYTDFSDTVWIRPNSMGNSYERDYAIRFNLDKEFPADKELIIDYVEIVIYATGDHSGITLDLYLDNLKRVSIPYSHYCTTVFDLKSLNISEKDRTLSFRKNIMIRFSKNSNPYMKMGICCATPGNPAGHIRGRLKNKVFLTPRKTCTYLTDNNKNITGMADEQGVIVATWDYDAFGNIIHQTGSMTDKNPLLFSSEYHDEDLGLIYYNYRHYNPKEGRWLSRDPLEENEGRNLYALINNNPLGFIDYTGRKKSTENSNQSDCQKKRQEQEKKIDEMIKNNQGEPPVCSNKDGCYLITFIVEMGNPCQTGVQSAIGHAGTAVEQNFRDFGPQNPQTAAGPGTGWWANPENTHWDGNPPAPNMGDLTLDDIRNNIGKLAQQLTVQVEFCACKSMRDQILNYWNNLYTQIKSSNPPRYSIPGLHCTSAACRSLTGKDSPNHATLTPLQFLQKYLVPQQNMCGNQQGKPAKISSRF